MSSNTGKTVLTSLVAGETDRAWDLGIYTQQPPASVSDRVWFDTNWDGVQDPEVAGVVVRLYDAAGNLVAETVTDGNGNYLFQNLVPGVYFVQFVPPPENLKLGKGLGSEDSTSVL